MGFFIVKWLKNKFIFLISEITSRCADEVTWCDKAKENGDCDKPGPMEKCMATCDLCKYLCIDLFLYRVLSRLYKHRLLCWFWDIWYLFCTFWYIYGFWHSFETILGDGTITTETPSATSETPTSCVDQVTWCDKAKENGDCDKPGPMEKCMATCNICKYLYIYFAVF